MKNSKKKPLFKIIFLLVIIFLITILFIIYPYIKPVSFKNSFKDSTQLKESLLVEDFITNNLSDHYGGIFTNYENLSSKDIETKGHSVLSESQGLMMLYGVATQNKNIFDKSLNFVNNNLKLENNLISWRTEPNKKNLSSAFIDDIRIAKALCLGYETFNKFSYRYQSQKLSEALLKNSLINNIPSDFKDEFGNAQTFTLCYGDLEAMDMLSNYNDLWSSIRNNVKSLIDNGRIPNSIFFRKYYDITNEKYSMENEVELLYSLITWENLYDDGYDIKPIITWLKNELVNNGYLCTKYSFDGKITEKIESTAIYAIALRLSNKYGDDELFNILKDKLLNYQVKSGDLKGGFGMESTKQFYSFDNLEALLALFK